MTEHDQDPDKGNFDALIDRHLQLMYQDLIQEGLPDHFRDLLAVIKAEDQIESVKGGDE